MKSLKLDLNYNNLEEDTENMKFLCEGMKKLPQNLQKFRLNLVGNDLGYKEENIKYLG